MKDSGKINDRVEIIEIIGKTSPYQRELGKGGDCRDMQKIWC